MKGWKMTVEQKAKQTYAGVMECPGSWGSAQYVVQPHLTVVEGSGDRGH